MKNLLFVLVLFVSITAQAQDDFNGGITLGFNATQIDGDGYMGFNKLGARAGAFVIMPLSQKVNSKIEFVYTGKGSVLNIPKQGRYQRIVLNYVEIPILLQVPYKKFVLEGGLAYGRLISSSEEDISGTMTFLGPYKKSEYSYILGFNVPLGGRFESSMRYQRSFLPVADNLVFDKVMFAIVGGAFNTMVTIGINYKILSDD